VGCSILTFKFVSFKFEFWVEDSRKGKKNKKKGKKLSVDTTTKRRDECLR